jgi:hypothetical protein
VLVSLLEARAFTNDLMTDLAAGFGSGGGYWSSSEWNYHHVGNYHLTGAAPPAPHVATGPAPVGRT